jgi:hypothetical protein
LPIFALKASCGERSLLLFQLLLLLLPTLICC